MTNLIWEFIEVVDFIGFINVSFILKNIFF